MKKHNKLKRITAGLTALLMTGVLSSPLISLAATVADNQSGKTLDDLAPNDTMDTNFGTIKNNNGTVTTNKGIITTNNGTVTTNEESGIITNNDNKGTVDTNEGTITTNEGMITTNNNTIEFNNANGTVENNNSKITNNDGGTITTNEEGGTVISNAYSGTIKNNNGTVTTNNNGTITTNNGTVTTNNSTITTNEAGGTVTTNDGGTVTDNKGKVDTNNGTITTNNGRVSTNNTTITTNNNYVISNSSSGTVGTNASNALVNTNDGTVTTNDGTVNANIGTIKTNKGSVTDNAHIVESNEAGGTIDTNSNYVFSNTGTITTNNGTVDTNVGTIETNNLTVGTNKNTITDNFGTVNTNEGTIVNNYGTVVTDNGIGTVTNRYYEIDLSSAPNVELSGEGYSFKNGKHYVLDGKSVTISPAEGYRIDAPPTVTSGTIGDNNDGTYTLSGVTANTALTVSTSPIAVDNITGVPSSMTEGESLTLSGTVEPSDALNQTITWSVKDAGTTGATISGNVLSADSEGTVVVTATIANGYNYGHFAVDFIMDFTITVSKPVYAVTVIGGTGGTAKANPASASAGTVITLTAAADEGYEFTGWKVTAGTVTLTDTSSPSAAFTMPSSAVTIEASFTPSEDTPTTDTPTTDTPTTDTPTTDTPSGDTPSGDTPSGDTPSTDTPGTDTPSGDTPSGDTPSTDTPNTAPSGQVGRVVIGELTEVPDSLKDRFPTLDELKAAMLSRALVQGGYTEGNTVFYDIKLQRSLDGGKTWVAATEDNFPKEGITVKLPYPDGTGSLGYDFAVAHMFTLTSERLGTTAGDVEAPQVTELADGLQVTFKGLSPVSVSWKNTETGSTPGGTVFKDTETTSPKTGDFGAVKVISSAAEKM